MTPQWMHLNIFNENYHGYAAITTICWAISNVMTGIAMKELSTFSLTFWRYTVAAMCLVPILVIKRIKPPNVRDIPLFFLCGGLGFLLYTIFFNLGCQETTAAVSSTIIAAVPILTALAARILLKERLTKAQWFGMILAFTGVLGLLINPNSFTLTSGTTWLLGAAIFLSGYNLLQRKLTDRYSALQTSAYSILCGSILLCFFAHRALAELQGTSPKIWSCVIVMGVLSSAVAYVCWAKAFSIAPDVSSVTNYMFLTPFEAGLLGFIVSKEVVTLRSLIGGTMILVGLLLFQKNKVKRT